MEIILFILVDGGVQRLDRVGRLVETEIEAQLRLHALGGSGLAWHWRGVLGKYARTTGANAWEQPDSERPATAAQDLPRNTHA